MGKKNKAVKEDKALEPSKPNTETVEVIEEDKAEVKGQEEMPSNLTAFAQKAWLRSKL